MIYIGIDPGRKTGLAWAQDKQYQAIETLKIHRALKIVEKLIDGAKAATIVIEDARLRGCSYRGQARAQGAGSVKRDCVIWQDFLNDYQNEPAAEKEINILFVAPGRSMTKVNQSYFINLTGWKARTSEHARDAAMLLLGPAQISRLDKGVSCKQS